MGIAIPAWYLAPQKTQVAEAGWKTTAAFSGVLDDGPIQYPAQPANATTLLQLAGEFANPATKRRIWEAAEAFIEPTWDRERGEFTLGLGLNEAHPRGQWNARMMAGWVCTEGAWSRIFNEPNFKKFDEPTIEGVDFPAIALSEARWDGEALHIAAQPQNSSFDGKPTVIRVTNIESAKNWVTREPDPSVKLIPKAGYLEVTLLANNRVVVIQPG